MYHWLFCLLASICIHKSFALTPNIESYDELYKKYKETGGAFKRVPAIEVMKIQLPVDVPTNDAALAAKFVHAAQQKHINIQMDTKSSLGIYRSLKRQQDSYCQEIYAHLKDMLFPRAIPTETSPAYQDPAPENLPLMAEAREIPQEEPLASVEEPAGLGEKKPQDDQKSYELVADQTSLPLPIANRSVLKANFEDQIINQQPFPQSAEYDKVENEQENTYIFNNFPSDPPAGSCGGEHISSLWSMFSPFIMAYQNLETVPAFIKPNFLEDPTLSQVPAKSHPEKEIPKIQKFFSPTALPEQIIQLLLLLGYTLLSLALSHHFTTIKILSWIRQSTLYQCVMEDIADLSQKIIVQHIYLQPITVRL